MVTASAPGRCRWRKTAVFPKPVITASRRRRATALTIFRAAVGVAMTIEGGIGRRGARLTPNPALATRTSSLLNAAGMRSTARSRSPSRVTSQGITTAGRPVFAISAASASSRSSRRAASATSAPSRANSWARAAPMPDDAPVMKTALPAKRWRRSPNGVLWVLEDDGLFGVGDGGPGLADRVAVVALRLGVLVVGFGLGEELLGFVDELSRLRAHLTRFRLLDGVLGLLDHDGAVVSPGGGADEDERGGQSQGGDDDPHPSAF